MLVRNLEDIPSFPYGEGAQKRVVIGPNEGAPNFVMRVFDVPPGGASSHHSHDFEHEVYVLQGEATLKAPTGDMPVRPGSAVFIPANEQHQLRNTGKETLRFLCMVPLHGEDSV
jgi:quercetin dioxygenase-like cupin family protein